MAWDNNATLMQGVKITGSAQGAWTRITDLYPAQGQSGPQWTPRSGTMLLNTGGYGFSRMGVVEFVFWLRGVTFTGAPTNVSLTLDVEEADDASGTNVQTVCRFRLGTGAATYARVDSATPATPAATQYVQVGVVSKQYLRWNATVVITGGASPTVTYGAGATSPGGTASSGCDLRARALYADIEIRPPAE